MELDGIEGRVAFVTGGAQGIGRCLTETFVRLGARAVAGDLSAPEIDGALGVTIDVTDEQSVDEAFSEIEATLGPVELLVLSAGILHRGPLADLALSDWQRVLDVNLTGPFLCARRAVPAMGAAGYGRVVFIGSSAGINGAGAAPPPLAAYAASKGGVMALAKSIAGEYARSGVTVNSLAPTLIDTGMLSTLSADFRGVVPVGRYGTPQEVADLAAFLCSASSGFITGAIVDINGGYLMH